MPIKLTIKEAEERHPALVKGQRWRGHAAYYKYLCPKHGIFLKDFNHYDQGQGCQICRHRSANMLSKTPEYRTVWNHFRCIKMPHLEAMKRNYGGMPFYDGWNPKKGGSFAAGAEWILANLGKRPVGCTMHIINHEKGFVPENLEWTGRQKQSNQKMFKIIAQLKHRIKELERELSRRPE